MSLRLAPVALFAVLAAVAPTPALAVSAVQAGTPAAAQPTEAEARRFLSAYIPRDMQRSGELAALRTTLIPTLKKDPGLASMLVTWPDLGPAMLKAMEGQIDVYIDEFNERFPPLAVPVIRSGLSQSELRDVTAFYASPLGQRVIRTSAAKIDASEVAELGMKGEAVDINVANRQTIGAGLAMIAELSPEDRRGLFAFSASPAGRKFMTVRDQLMSIQAELISKPGPRFQAASERAILEAMQRVTGVKLTPGS
jgi:hypothetical protein